MRHCCSPTMNWKMHARVRMKMENCLGGKCKAIKFYYCFEKKKKLIDHSFINKYLPNKFRGCKYKLKTKMILHQKNWFFDYSRKAKILNRSATRIDLIRYCWLRPKDRNNKEEKIPTGIRHSAVSHNGTIVCARISECLWMCVCVWKICCRQQFCDKARF